MSVNSYNNISNIQIIRDKSSSGWLIILFLIWPFAAFIFAVQNIYKRINRFIIVAFFILYGYTFVINPLMDGQRYADRLEEVAQKPFHDVYSIFQTLYEDDHSLDFVEKIILYVVSRVTNEHFLLFATFALIFSLFYMSNIKKLADKYKSNKNINALIFMILFCFIVPIFNINGFRFYTATIVFFYGVYNYIDSKKYKYLLFCALSVFIHFSFLTAIGIFVLYLVLGNWPYIYLILSLVTLGISELPTAPVQEYSEYMGAGFNEKAKRYTHESYVDSVNKNAENVAWFIKIQKYSLIYFFALMLSIIVMNLRKMKFDKNFLNLLSLTLLFFSFSNILDLYPSGGRFRSVFYLLCLSLIIAYYSLYYIRKKITYLSYISIVPVGLNILVMLRIGADTINISLLLPGLLFGLYNDVSIQLSSLFF